MTNIPKKVFIFLKEIKLEMKKVNWPSRQRALRYSLIVIGASFAVAIFLGSVDYIFSRAIDKFVL